MDDTTDNSLVQFILGGELTETTEDTTEEIEAEAAPLDETDEDTGEEAEPQETEAENEDEAEAEEPDAEPQPDLYTVKVNGAEKQVTLDELKRDFSGQQYINQRMQEAAAKIKEAEQLQQQAIAVIQHVTTNGLKPLPTPPDPALADTDPVKYIKAQAKYQKQVQEYSEEQYRIKAIQEQADDAAIVARNAELTENAARLIEKIPAFADPRKGEALAQELIRIGEDYGYSAKDIKSVTDHRAVQVLHDAAQWRKLQAAKAQPDKPGAPKVVKPAAKRAEPPQLAEKKILERAVKSQNPDDWLAYLTTPKR